MDDINKTEEIVTQVTSIANEEEKTGEKVKLPNDEEMRNRAMGSFIISSKALLEIFVTLSARGKNRVLASIIDLPTDGVPVKLKDDAEKQCFALGQRILSDRFLLTYYHIVEEAKKSRELNKKESETNLSEGEEKNDGQ